MRLFSSNRREQERSTTFPFRDTFLNSRSTLIPLGFNNNDNDISMNLLRIVSFVIDGNENMIQITFHQSKKETVEGISSPFKFLKNDL
jgi:hypothetical protein